MTRPVEFRVWYDGKFDPDKHGMYYQGDATLLHFFSYHSPENLMQFTGLLDRAGKKIFEGDILAVDWGDGIVHAHVYWDSSCLTYMVQFKGNGDTEFLYETDENSEIIGNIYQNPELIK